MDQSIWRVEYVKGKLYRLRNTSAADVTDLEVEGRPTVAAGMVKFLQPGTATVPAGDTVDVMVLAADGARPSGIAAKWAGQSGWTILPLP